ncbi:LacI family DNA-binding transcriptional regulator [Bifidobacterium sp. ESL0704]|uniref:LacI family DNA-binding transcriptional regulator n=1 Tax=Bifidobacterium sp. ESL0704 TaxID=2983219 RepID=UPI0023F89CC6|nr:LacI family DNA-binding transcriptional regulator [Bifidobacterium sp. ESL0704]WEV53116.1 LacI family DNA-binding transcriptional regulator [Bifidobacterium sp. ESL0704]
MATIYDVAKEAGVSKSTVSYVLSGSKLIQEKTADRVRKAAKKIGYSANYAAKTLSTSKTNTIGILAPKHDKHFFSLSFGAYLYSLSQYIREQGFDTLLLTDDDGVEALERTANSKRVDGIIIMDIRDDDPRVKAAAHSGIPTVLLGKPHDACGLDVVDTDFGQIAAVLVDHLANAGHRDVLFIGWPQPLYDSEVNYATRFRSAALAEAQNRNMRLHVICPTSDTANMAHELHANLKSHPESTAVIIHNDAVLIGSPQIFNRLEISIPKDLSLVTVIPDQMGIGMHLQYDAVIVHLDEVAKETVDMLIDRIAHPNAPARQRLIMHPLSLTGSVNNIQ